MLDKRQNPKTSLTDEEGLQSEQVYFEMALSDGWVALSNPALAEYICLSVGEALKLLDVLKQHEAAIRSATGR